MDKCEHLTGEDVIPPHEQRIMQEAKSTYFSLGKVYEKQGKAS